MDHKAIRKEYHAAITREWRVMPEGARADIPSHLQDGLDRYILERIPTGAFLRAVLENNLAGACLRANPRTTLYWLPDLLRVLATYAPGASHGSPEKVAAWLAAGKEEEDNTP